MHLLVGQSVTFRNPLTGDVSRGTIVGPSGGDSFNVRLNNSAKVVTVHEKDILAAYAL
jgi:hypothetical protein